MCTGALFYEYFHIHNTYTHTHPDTGATDKSSCIGRKHSQVPGAGFNYRDKDGCMKWCNGNGERERRCRERELWRGDGERERAGRESGAKGYLF